MTISQGQAQDKILQYILENENRGLIPADEISREVFGNGATTEEVIFLIEKISRSADEVATVRRGDKTR